MASLMCRAQTVTCRGAARTCASGPPEAGGRRTGCAVNLLVKDVEMPGMPCRLFDHVDRDPAQRYPPQLVRALVVHAACLKGLPQRVGI